LRSFRRQPPLGSRHRFLTLPLSVSGFPLAWVRASPLNRRLASFQAESRSLSYGLIVHLPLLPTPPHGRMQLQLVTGRRERT
ncbi:MAG TPA: hypothetical protein VFJ27_01190, partial [Terriglobia bacterium]|nr:hypothetical protein [Terriglobia bacterium]